MHKKRIFSLRRDETTSLILREPDSIKINKFRSQNKIKFRSGCRRGHGLHQHPVSFVTLLTYSQPDIITYSFFFFLIEKYKYRKGQKRGVMGLDMANWTEN
jgi:hypothetical protein